MNTIAWNAAPRIVFYSAFFSIFFLVLSLLDPFGIDDAADRHSRTILYRAFASLYEQPPTNIEQFEDRHPVWEAPQTDDEAPVFGQDQIVTVYLNENVLNMIRMQLERDAFEPAMLEEMFGKSKEELTEDERQILDAQLQLAGWQSWRPNYYDHADMVSSVSSIWRQESPDVVAMRADAEYRTGQQQTTRQYDLRPPPAVFFDYIFLQDGAGSEEQSQFEFFKGTVTEITRHDVWGDLTQYSPDNLPDGFDAEQLARGCGAASSKRAGMANENSAPGVAFSPFERLVCIKAVGGIPLIFAKGVGVNFNKDDEIPPAQRALHEHALVLPVNYFVEQGDYPLKSDGLSSLQRKNGQLSGDVMPSMAPTPAVMLYLSWCMDADVFNGDSARCEWLEPPSLDQLTPIARMRHMVDRYQQHEDDFPISLRWGVSVPNYFADLEYSMTGKRPILTNNIGPTSRDEPLQCRKEVGGFSTILTVLFRQSLFNNNAERTDGLAQPCPFHLEVPYFAIASNAADYPVAKAIFDGRIIIVGARFRNSSDTVLSPVHGQLPGMHWHAMATDNLINRHNDYVRSPQENLNVLFWELDWLDVAETIVMFIILLVVSWGQFRLNKRLIFEERNMAAFEAKPINARPENTGEPHRPSHWRTYLAVISGVILILIFAGYLNTMVFNLAPPNWISLSATSIGVFIYLLRDEISDDISRLLRRTPGLSVVCTPALDGLVKLRGYLDMETVGFEKSENSMEDARSEKNRVVDQLYKELTDARGGEDKPTSNSPFE